MSTLPIDAEQAKRIYARLYHQQEAYKRSLEQAEEARKSFRKFVPLAWPVIMPSVPYIPNCYHIEAIADHLQAVADGHIQNLMIVVPPGSAKSSLSSVMFPAFKWINDPKWRSVWASYDAGLSTRDSVACRDLIQSSWYQESFKPGWKLKPDQNEKTYYYNTEKGFRMSTSVDGSGTGHRANFLGIDDPLSTAARFSQATLDACIRWYKTVWHNRLINMDTGSRVVIGQRVSDNDLIGYLLRVGGWECLHIQMEYDPARSKVTSIGWSDWRKEKGELMFEPLFSRETVDKLKEDADTFATQYQGVPNVEGGGILKAYQWNYWQPAGMNLPKVRVRMPDDSIQERVAVDLPDGFDLMLQSWDLTFGKSDTSDFVCGQVHAVRGARRFILDQIMKRMGIVETMASIRELTGRYPKAHLKIIEKAANATAAHEMLERDIPGMILVPPEGSKVACASAGAPELQAGNWFLPHPMIAPWVGDPENPLDGGFLASASLFPFGPHDDDIDAWSHGAMRIQKENLGGLFGVSEKDIRVDPLAIDAKWPRMFGLAINWREVGAVWLTRQPDTNQHYLYAEHYAPASDPAHHATVIKTTTPEDWVVGFVHVTDEGRVERDGFAMIKKFKDLGVKLQGMPGSEETEIMAFSEALRSGKLKVFGSCARFFDQFRMGRRNENTGKLPSQGINVLRAALVAWSAHEKMKAPPEPAKPDRLSASYSNLPPQGGWMA